MSGTWGEYLKLSIFGESHGQYIGVTMNGLAPGIELDLGLIRKELARRAPGKSGLTSPRQENDEFEIISGYFAGKTTGAPLSFLIKNKDRISTDYEAAKDVLRPSHADYTARIKYSGFNDYRGSGHFSGRMTAPLVLAGAIAKQILGGRGMYFGSHILSIGQTFEEYFSGTDISASLLQKLTDQDFPVLDPEIGALMKKQILKARDRLDSVGGIIETAVQGLPVGLGSPFFDSVESKIAHLLFAVPAVKGVEFGAGFGIAKMCGSEANDQFNLQKGKVRTLTNHSGGIQGGITNGMPIVFRTAFKPTPTIGSSQKTVDFAAMEEVEIRMKGRHDPCIVPRALPVAEAAAALALLDLMIEKDGILWMK